MTNPKTIEDILLRLSNHDSIGFQFREEAMRELDRLEGYDWCGIYRLEGEMLVLDAFVGAKTDHEKIPVGRGVCGTAVATGETQVIADVRAIENYLSCSIETRAEIVVLIKDSLGEILGQIDIDSHQLDRFSDSDRDFLESLASLIATRWN